MSENDDFERIIHDVEIRSSEFFEVTRNFGEFITSDNPNIFSAKLALKTFKYYYEKGSSGGDWTAAAEVAYLKMVVVVENYLFVRAHDIVTSPVSESELVHKKEGYFDSYLNKLNDLIESSVDSHKRMGIIVNEISLNRELCVAEDFTSESIISLPRKAIKYLEQIHSTIIDKNETFNKDNVEFEKIQTTLTVEQLALLFRILKDLKLIDTDKGIPNLAKAISSVFSTKRAENISINTIKNDFEKPKSNAVSFWQDQKQPIQTIINKYKENNSK